LGSFRSCPDVTIGTLFGDPRLIRDSILINAC